MKTLLMVFMMICISGILIGEPIQVGVTWTTKSAMTTNVYQGFKDGLKEMEIKDIVLEEKIELKNDEEMAKVVAEFETTKKGMLVLRSAGGTWLSKNPPKIPAFLGACNHPQKLGVVQNLEAPEGNITGVSYFLDIAIQFEVFKMMLPKMESVYLLMEEGHPSAPIDEARTKETCEKLGVKFTGKKFKTLEELLAVVKENQGKVSAFIIGSQRLVMDNAAKIVETAQMTPVLSYSNKPVTAGALGGFAADDFKLGRELAKQVVDVLINKKAIKDVPVKFDTKPIFYINAKTAEKLQLEIPFEVLEMSKMIE